MTHPQSMPDGLLTLLVQPSDGDMSQLRELLHSLDIQFWNWFPGVWLLTHPGARPSLEWWRERLLPVLGDTSFLLIDAADQTRNGDVPNVGLVWSASDDQVTEGSELSTKEEGS